MPFSDLLQSLGQWLLRMALKALGLLLLGLLFWGGWAAYDYYKHCTTSWQRATLHFSDGRPDLTARFATDADTLVVEDLCVRSTTQRHGKRWVVHCLEHQRVYRDQQGQTYPLRHIKGYTLSQP